MFFSMLSFSVNSMSSRAARPMLTAVGRADVRWHSESLMKDTRSSPPAPPRSSTARLRQPTMAMAGAPRTCRVKGHRVTAPPALLITRSLISHPLHSQTTFLHIHLFILTGKKHSEIKVMCRSQNAVCKPIFYSKCYQEIQWDEFTKVPLIAFSEPFKGKRHFHLRVSV